jgi:hypothetical protein
MGVWMGRSRIATCIIRHPHGRIHGTLLLSTATSAQWRKRPKVRNHSFGIIGPRQEEVLDFFTYPVSREMLHSYLTQAKVERSLAWWIRLETTVITNHH